MNTRKLLSIDNPLLTNEIDGLFFLFSKIISKLNYVSDTTDKKGDGVSAQHLIVIIV
jgi:hypothetical protein